MGVFDGWSPLLTGYGLVHLTCFLVLGLRHRRVLTTALLFAAVPGLQLFLLGLFIGHGKAAVVAVTAGVVVPALAGAWYAAHRAGQAERRSLPS